MHEIAFRLHSQSANHSAESMTRLRTQKNPDDSEEWDVILFWTLPRRFCLRWSQVNHQNTFGWRTKRSYLTCNLKAKQSNLPEAELSNETEDLVRHGGQTWRRCGCSSLPSLVVCRAGMQMTVNHRSPVDVLEGGSQETTQVSSETLSTAIMWEWRENLRQTFVCQWTFQK